MGRSFIVPVFALFPAAACHISPLLENVNDFLEKAKNFLCDFRQLARWCLSIGLLESVGSPHSKPRCTHPFAGLSWNRPLWQVAIHRLPVKSSRKSTMELLKSGQGQLSGSQFPPTYFLRPSGVTTHKPPTQLAHTRPAPAVGRPAGPRSDTRCAHLDTAAMP